MKFSSDVKVDGMVYFGRGLRTRFAGHARERPPTAVAPFPPPLRRPSAWERGEAGVGEGAGWVKGLV